MMGRSMLVLAMVAGLVGFAAAPASAQVQTTFTLTATLFGGNETPPVNTAAFGDATVVVDLVARTVTYTVRVFNMPSGTTASHIHVGSPQLSGPVVVNFDVPRQISNDYTFSGVVRDTEFVLRPDQGVRSADDMFQAILGNNSYVNVHSNVNGGGEIRGQLILKP